MRSQRCWCWHSLLFGLVIVVDVLVILEGMDGHEHLDELHLVLGVGEVRLLGLLAVRGEAELHAGLPGGEDV